MAQITNFKFEKCLIKKFFNSHYPCLDPTNTDSKHPLLGLWSPRCSTATKLRGDLIRPYILEALGVSDTT